MVWDARNIHIIIEGGVCITISVQEAMSVRHSKVFKVEKTM